MPRPFLSRSVILLAACALALGGRAQSDAPAMPPVDVPTMPVERVPIYFPPNPPPLDRPVGHGVPEVSHRYAAAPELAAYVNDCFYPALATRLQLGHLSSKLRQRFEEYQ